MAALVRMECPYLRVSLPIGKTWNAFHCVSNLLVAKPLIFRDSRRQNSFRHSAPLLAMRVKCAWMPLISLWPPWSFFSASTSVAFAGNFTLWMTSFFIWFDLQVLFFTQRHFPWDSWVAGFSLRHISHCHTGKVCDCLHLGLALCKTIVNFWKKSWERTLHSKGTRAHHLWGHKLLSLMSAWQHWFLPTTYGLFTQNFHPDSLLEAIKIYNKPHSFL